MEVDKEKGKKNIVQVIIQQFSIQMSNWEGGWNEVKWVAGIRLFV